jgi:hypothetical protein
VGAPDWGWGLAGLHKKIILEASLTKWGQYEYAAE